jgi:hypothetical protein
MLMRTGISEQRMHKPWRLALICAFLFLFLNISAGSSSSTNYGTPITIGTPTYDGMGQTVHPDVLFIPGGFGPEGWPYWMAVTPYPNGNDAYENPSILVSRDGLRWTVPQGLKNPLVNRPQYSRAHNSDPEIVLVDDTLYLYFRESFKHLSTPEHRLYLMKSTDGIKWSAPVEVMVSRLTAADLMSPAVLYDGKQFTMWFVNYPQLKVAYSQDGVTWSIPQDCVVQGLDSDRFPWHLDVVRGEDRLESLFMSSTGSGGTGSRMHYAYSFDEGKTWQVAPLMRELTESFEASMQYRGTLLPRSDDPYFYDLWYSARSAYGTWRVAYMQVVRRENQLYPAE